jgi:hypothetical protein
MGAYIRKRRPLEFEITFKQKIVCSWEHAYCTQIACYALVDLAKCSRIQIITMVDF